MGFLLFGLFSLIALLWAADKFMQANPAVLAGRIKGISAAVVLAVAVILLMRGVVGPAILIGSIGLWLLDIQNVNAPWPGRSQKPPGQTSRVKTDHLDMEIDHDTGSMNGRVLKGIFQGRTIGNLKPVELAHLWADCRFVDPQSARILEAYLDRIHPTWREDMARGEREMASGPDGRMSNEEAYEILGLEPGASPDDIRTAHRELMKKMHPDRGGSTYLASKINEAKDVLLGG